ncbi:MAG: hypothetical protein ABSB12_02405 [Candidatus Saccharimonadales bacterium]|jgi:hypothetical protein
MAKNKQFSSSKRQSRVSIIRLPSWAVLFYTTAAAILIPWTVYLSMTLPTRQITHHWDIVWEGFDCLVILMLALTAYFIAKKSIWVMLSASSLGTCLIIDSWFDVLTSRRGIDLIHSILLAFFIELPVAILSWYFAILTARQCSKTYQKP